MSRYSPRTQLYDPLISDWGKHLSPLKLSGGQETVTVGGYQYIVFTSSGDLIVSTKSYGVVDVLTVGGGGGGVGSSGAGGGAAEVDYWTSCAITANVPVTIGAGGLGVSTGGGNNGGSTSFGSFVTTLGGGSGGAQYSAGITGGSSGGGGGGAITTSPAGTGNNTNAGGSGGHLTSGGGGGGATAAGQSSNVPVAGPVSGKAGDGGAGLLLTTIDANLTSANFPITLAGMTRVSAGGGGGQSQNYGGSATRGLGGTGGGGNGGQGPNSVAGSAGTSYGSGGGGGAYDNNGALQSGYAGFKGVCIVRFLLP